MLWHPLLISIIILDIAILILLSKSGGIALTVILRWTPGSHTHTQLQLERRFETADIMTQWAFVLMIFNTLTLVVAITQVLPSLIPGAMCGMGVMQALNGKGYQLTAIKGMTLCLLYWQRIFAGLNHYDPMSPLTILLARLQLLALLFEAMVAYDTLTIFFLHLDTTQPVSCCAALYDQINPLAKTTLYQIWQAPFWPVAFGSFTLPLLIFSVKALTTCNITIPYKISVLICIIGILWVFSASISLIFFLTPYIYQVLGHHCPFCLFLPEHYSIGFLLFGQLFGVSLHSPLPIFLNYLQSDYPGLSRAIESRYRWTVHIIIGCVSGFLIMSVLPALIWRLRFGVWI